MSKECLISKKIRVHYCLKNIFGVSFTLMIPRESTIKDFLDLISKKHNDIYTTLFYNRSEIDSEDLIIDYIEDDPQFIFIASLDSKPPPNDFVTKYIENIEYQKKYNQNLVKLGKTIEPPKPIPKVPPPKLSKTIVKPPVQVPMPKVPGKISAPKVPEKISPQEPKKVVIPIKAPKIGKELSHATPNVITPSKQDTPNVDSYHRYETPYSIIQEYISSTPIERSKEESEQYLRKAVNYDSKDVFTFYCTGGDKNMLLNGFKVELILSMNQKQCNEALLKYLKTKIDITNKKLLIYLPGGIPFIEGKLGDIFLSNELKVKNVIYGVITRSIPDKNISDIYHEICYVKDQWNKILISPLVDSTDRGLSDMACLMGYFHHDGIKGEALLRQCAMQIHFPPFITSLRRIIDREHICGRDIVTVTSTFYTFFRAILPLYCPDNRVYEYTLTLCNVILYDKNISNDIPLIKYDVSKGDGPIKLFSELKYENIIYFWKGDAGIEFQWIDIQFQIDELMENSNKIFQDFTPVEPIYLRYQSGCTIIKGKNHEILYLMQSSSKDAKTNNVDILDPIAGTIESVDCESYALLQKKTKKEITSNLIKEDRVKEIIVIDFDESLKMYSDIDGNSDSETNNRNKIGYQFLRLFLDFMYYKHIPCFQSLVTFNKDIKVSSSFSTIDPDSEICFNETPVTQKHSSKLWDSLYFCCEEIQKFRKDNHGEEIYVNAVSRILVISTGIDHNSSSEVHHVTKKLIKNKIIVDSIILSQDKRSKMLCAVSHATGGLSFCPKNIEECMKLLDHPAFVNYEIRKNNDKPLIEDDMSTLPSQLKLSMITISFMRNARHNAIFDNEIISKDTDQDFQNASLATLRSIYSKYKDSINPNIRQKRILKELRVASEIYDPKSNYYDPDMSIFLVQSRIDLWKVFMKGPYGTLYEGKWWELHVIFPELYPFHMPIFKFISIPYHPNVSIDGTVCIDSINCTNIQDKYAVDILQNIKELFLLPNIHSFIQVETLDTYIHDREKYNRLQKESTDKNKIVDYNDFLKPVLIIDDIIDESTIKTSNDNQPNTNLGEKQDKKGEETSSITYDKEELKQLIRSNKNPISIIKGKPLKETKEYSSDDYI